MDPDDNELGIFTVIQWVVVCCALFFVFLVIQSDLMNYNCQADIMSELMVATV